MNPTEEEKKKINTGYVTETGSSDNDKGADAAPDEIRNKPGSFEDSLNALRNAANRIKDQNTSLEEAIRCYEEGMKHYEACRRILDKAEQKIRVFEAGGNEDI